MKAFNMKWLLLLLVVCLITNCINSSKKKMDNSIAKIDSLSKFDTLGMDSQIKDFEKKYNNISKQSYDSISQYENNNIDFSDMTGGLERKYKECNIEFEKVLLGYKLAQNYYIHFDSSKEVEYCEKAKPLFYAFVIYKNGELASHYLNLDITKVHSIEKEWMNFSELDKREIMFYGLLRGFNDGLPDILKNVK